MSMRLLQKSAVNKAKAIDRQREIDEGAKLAKRVDSLRQLADTEEKNVLAFREQSMATVRAELQPLYEQKSALLKELEGLKVQKKLLLEPLDAKWDEVSRAQKICDDWEEELTAREDLVARNEDKNFRFKTSLDSREEHLARIADKAELDAFTADHILAEAKEVLAGARNEAQSSKMQSELVIADAMERETAIAVRERDVEIGRENNEKTHKEYEERLVRLIDREETLERGFAELKRKK